jgi:hypothetical protein
MIRKSGHRFSEKIMLKQRDKRVMQFNLIASGSYLPTFSSIPAPFYFGTVTIGAMR